MDPADSVNAGAEATDPDAEERSRLNVPQAREASTQEKVRADRLLSEANLARRRENFQDAEAKCHEAIDLTPGDAAAIEMLGDIVQGVARIDEALLAYRRAARLDPKRASAERKYADLVVRQERVTEPEPDVLPRSPWIAVMLSIAPGAGQIYNGERVKGGVMLAAFVALVLAWNLMGGPTPPPPARNAPRSVRSVGRLDSGQLAILTLGALLYIYAPIDANMGTKRKTTGGRRSGWEV